MSGPPLIGLDSRLTPPPPLTSFTGCRSRIMASFRSLLSLRQTDRTTLTFVSCIFLLKQFLPSLFRGNVLTDESRSEQAEKLRPRSCRSHKCNAIRYLSPNLCHPRNPWLAITCRFPRQFEFEMCFRSIRPRRLPLFDQVIAWLGKSRLTFWNVLVKLPAVESEIDCKLQSNSR